MTYFLSSERFATASRTGNLILLIMSTKDNKEEAYWCLYRPGNFYIKGETDWLNYVFQGNISRFTAPGVVTPVQTGYLMTSLFQKIGIVLYELIYVSLSSIFCP